MRIFKLMRDHWVAVLLCFGLLVVQANLELALPGYMSDIIDVGIQQGGIESAVPATISTDDLDDLELFMAEPDRVLVDRAYGPADAQGVRAYVGSATDAAAGGPLSQTMARAECVVLSLEKGIDPKAMGTKSLEASDPAMAQLMATPQGRDQLQDLQKAMEASGGKLNMDVVRSMVSAGLVSREDLAAMADSVTDSLGEGAEAMMEQRAVEYVRRALQSQGVDLEAVRMGYLGKIALIMAGLCAATLVTTVAVGLIASRTAASIARDLRHRLFSKVMELSPAEVNDFSQSSLITRCTNDVQQVQMAIVMFLRVVLLAPIMGVVAFIQVTATHSGLEWIIGVALLALLAIVGILMGLTMPRFKRMQSLVDAVNLDGRAMLDGLMPIRAFGREDYELARFEKSNGELMATQLFTNRAMAFMMPAIMLLMNLLSLGIVWFGAGAVDAGTLQVGSMMAFISYAIQIIMAFMILSMVSVMLPRAEVSAGRIDEVLQRVPSIADAPATEKPAEDGPRGELFFDDVTFGYPDADAPIVSHISFKTAPGHTTALIGSTGSGKTTLVKLIPRFYDVTGGSISLDGVDIRSMALEDLRSRIGYIPQQGLLLSGTIRSNVAFGAPEATDEEVWDALEIAQASDFVGEMDQGLDTPVAQGGTSVSGGQRQRLSIARALVPRPEVLVFDDSFSALDFATDARLREALATRVKDAAKVVVAQRVATIMAADEILVLDQGTLVGRGTHEELLASCPTYLEIARSQLSDEELDLTEAVANGLVDPADAPPGAVGDAPVPTRTPEEGASHES